MIFKSVMCISCFVLSSLYLDSSILADLRLLKGYSFSVACFVAFPPSVPEMVNFASDISVKEVSPF